MTALNGSGAGRTGPAVARAEGSAPSDFEGLSQRIGERFNDLPKQLQRIARFALDAPEDFALGTASQLATMIGVQPSALVRFANAVGFDGFADLRQVFRRQLRTRPSTYQERLADLRHRAPSATAPEAVLQAQIDQARAELGRMAAVVEPGVLRQAVELICTAPHIHLLGARRSFPVASYLAYALGQLDRRVHLLAGVAGMNRELAQRIPDSELLIAVSFRNYTPEVLEITQACRQRGMPVIAITDSKLSPLARASSLCFALGDDGGVAFRSLVEPIVLAQSLVVSVGHRLAELAQGARQDKTRSAKAKGASKGRR